MDNLDTLFKEKKIKEPTVKKTVKKPKKIKKKDIPIIPIDERELQFYEYNIIDGIKIYNGILSNKKEEMYRNIEFFKRLSNCDIFTEFQASTLTARGEFTNLNITEEELIKILGVPPIKYGILKVGCNYGEIYSWPNPYHNHLLFDMINSVKVLNNTNIKIGCLCNPLLDTQKVFDISKRIDENTEQFMELYVKNIKTKINMDKRYKEKKTAKILKNFTNIQNYKILCKEEVKELYTVLEHFIVDLNDLQFCTNHLNSIIELIEIFTSYEASCTCVPKYVMENNLQNHDKNELVKKIINTNRGRKPKKKSSKRKVQGTGKYFSSQITFEIYNQYNKKITKIKIFRNGCYQIPGVKQPDMTDLVSTISLLQDYLNDYFGNDKKIEIPYITSVMRNYTCRVTNLNITLILAKINDIFYTEKSFQLCKDISKYAEIFKIKGITDYMIHNIFKYCNIGFYHISEISLNSERYPGLLIKFLRSIPGKDNKKITIKILSSGKINIDGATSELEVYEIYYWLHYIFSKYFDKISFDSSKDHNEIVSEDSNSGYESIYDDQL